MGTWGENALQTDGVFRFDLFRFART